jgi:acetoin utilization deacetylase AcuC-like enzyme
VSLRAWSSSRFTIDLPPGHRFPIAKYAAIRDRVVQRGILPVESILEPDRAERWSLALVHTAEYLDKVYNGRMSEAEERRLGFPWSDQLRERSLRTVQATIEAARDALELGTGITLAGGTHHAFPDHAEGFCVFNDVAIAVRLLQREGRIDRALVVDLDVHQGNGTARIFNEDPDVYTFSMHGRKNYPFHKERGSLDIELDDGCGDGPYLELLGRHLEPAIEASNPGIVFYLAGSDPYRGDRFGRLGLSAEGLARRDRMVVETCRSRRLPLVLTMSGGYAGTVEEIAEIHAESVRIVIEAYG